MEVNWCGIEKLNDKINENKKEIQLVMQDITKTKSKI